MFTNRLETESFSKTLSRFKVLLASSDPDSINLFWLENPKLRLFFTHRHIDLPVLEMKDLIPIFKLVLSKELPGILTVLWEGNQRLQAWFRGECIDSQVITLDELSCFFKLALFNYNQLNGSLDIIQAMWDKNSLLQDWFCGEAVVMNRDSGQQQRRILPFKDLVLNFKAAVSSKKTLVIKAIWDKNPLLVEWLKCEPVSLGHDVYGQTMTCKITVEELNYFFVSKENYSELENLFKTTMMRNTTIPIRLSLFASLTAFTVKDNKPQERAGSESAYRKHKASVEEDRKAKRRKMTPPSDALINFNSPLMDLMKKLPSECSAKFFFVDQEIALQIKELPSTIRTAMTIVSIRKVTNKTDYKITIDNPSKYFETWKKYAGIFSFTSHQPEKVSSVDLNTELSAEEPCLPTQPAADLHEEIPVQEAISSPVDKPDNHETMLVYIEDMPDCDLQNQVTEENAPGYVPNPERGIYPAAISSPMDKPDNHETMLVNIEDMPDCDLQNQVTEENAAVFAVNPELEACLAHHVFSFFNSNKNDIYPDTDSELFRHDTIHSDLFDEALEAADFTPGLPLLNGEDQDNEDLMTHPDSFFHYHF